MRTQEERNNLARKVVVRMLRDDYFSQWLGVSLMDVEEGYAKIEMTLRKEMLNGFGIIHGGIVFSLADSAFAFACNNRNNISMALDADITFTKTSKEGEILIAEAKELHNGRTTGLYLITVSNQKGEQVAVFKGTCFRTGQTLLDT